MMSRERVAWFVAGAVILVIVLVLGGVSVSPWVYVLVGVACPVMMMGGIGSMGGGGGSAGGADDHNSPHSSLGSD